MRTERIIVVLFNSAVLIALLVVSLGIAFNRERIAQYQKDSRARDDAINERIGEIERRQGILADRVSKIRPPLSFEEQSGACYDRTVAATFQVVADYGMQMIPGPVPWILTQRRYINGGTGCSFVLQNGEGPYLATMEHIVIERELGPVPILPQKIFIRFKGRTWVEVELLGYTSPFDFALLHFKNPAETYYGNVLRFGDIRKRQVGTPVMAIGSPLGRFLFMPSFGHLMNPYAGTLSLDGLEPAASSQRATFGHSGGPLVALDAPHEILGFVQGAVASIPLDSIPKFVPAWTVEPLITKLQNPRELVHGSFGIDVRDSIAIAPPEAERAGLQLPTPPGVLVTNVKTNGPSHGKIVINDVITHVENRMVTSAQQLVLEELYTEPATTLVVSGLRDGKQFTVPITLGIYTQ